MSKLQLFFLSLIAAVPSAYLSFLLVMYLINQPSGSSTMVMAVAIVTLLCSATLAVIPALILTMYYSNYDPPKAVKAARGKGKDKKQANDEDAEDEEIEEIASSDEVEELVDDDGELIEDVEEEK